MRWNLSLLAMLCIATVARAETLSFDDLHGSGTIPDGYGGLNWSNFFYLDTTNPFGHNEANGFTSGTVSPPTVAYDNGGSVAMISGPSFTFSASSFTAAWKNDLEISVTGYAGGRQVGQSLFFVNPGYPSFEVFDFGPVDQVTFASSGGVLAGLTGTGSQFAMDNMVINLPEPAGASLPCAVAGFIALRRRRCDAGT